MLGKSFTTQKWLAVGLLSVGVALVQIPGGKELEKDEDDLRKAKSDVMVGLAAVLVACCTSAFSGHLTTKTPCLLTLSMLCRCIF